MSDKVVFVKPLRNHNDAAVLLTIESAQSRTIEPFITFVLWVSETAYSGFAASSTIIRSQPRPVRIPPTEVASLDPWFVVISSWSADVGWIVASSERAACTRNSS